MKFILIVLMFLPGLLRAGKIDSLQQIIEDDPPLEKKVEAMYNLAEILYYQDVNLSEKLATQMMQLSTAADYKKGIWKSYNITGYLHYLGSRYDSAIQNFEKALSLSEKELYVNERIFSFYWLASAHVQKTAYAIAEEFFQKSLSLSLENINVAAAAKAYMGLGMLNYQQSQYEKALFNYLKADSLYGDEISMNHGDVLQNIAIAYHVLDQRIAEEQYLNQALVIYESIDDQYGISHVSMRLGNIAKENNNFDKSLEHFEAAIPFFQNTKNNSKLAEIYSYIGMIHFEKKDFGLSMDYFNLATEMGEMEKFTEGYISLSKGLALANLGQLQAAIEFIVKADTLANELKSMKFKAKVYEGYAEYYKLTNNSAMVYQYMMQANKFIDSLAMIKSSESLHEMEAKYQNAKKQQEIELLAAQNDLKEEQKSKQLIVFLVIFSALIIVITALVFLNKLTQNANLKLKEADQLKSSFLTNISHEFRTPLHLISGPVEHRLKDRLLPAEQKQELEMIMRNSKQLLGLVDQLLELARLESDSIRLREDNIYLCSTLRSLASSFDYLAEQKQIDFQLQFPDNEYKVLTYPDALQKIIMNLLGNAFKYTPANGSIQLNTALQSNRLIMEVKNTGSGIEAARLKKIFTRFYQANPAADGLGIGLALVKELADKMGGEINVNSIPGEWTTFRIELPLTSVVDSSQEEVSTFSKVEAPEELTSQINRESKYTLLIIEDNADTRQMMHNQLAG
ncbi:MAG: ATP-binding protein, partial [Cyclobacteriaceae bacterium]